MELTCSVGEIKRLSPEQVKEILDTLLHERAGEERTPINALLHHIERPMEGGQQ